MRDIVLCGNPNCGKTSLMNALTGSMLPVGNWPGVTVAKKQMRLALPTGQAMLTDLPGLYTLGAHSVEEAVAAGHLRDGRMHLVVNVVDATCLTRNLSLTLCLRDAGYPVLVALNLMDALRKGYGSVDVAGLSRALGVPVVPVSAATGEGLEELLRAMDEHSRGDAHTPAPQEAQVPFDEHVNRATLRYKEIERTVRAARYVPQGTDSSPIDRIALHEKWAYPLFFAMLALMFFVTFGPIGRLLTGAMERMAALSAAGLSRALAAAGAAPLFRSLLLDGALAGALGVLCFMPQILLLFLMLTVLEDSGYMARAAFIWDRPLRTLGLSGRSFIPLVMGFGCTTSAAAAARSVDDERDRRMTIMLLPFMSCGAKLPVYALVGAAFFAKGQALMVLGLYMLGIMMMAGCGALLRRVTRQEESPFLLELPPYRAPRPRSVMRRLRGRAREFLVRAGTLIFLMSLFAWLLQSVTPQLRWAESAQGSLFAHIARCLVPLMRPIGLGDWRQCAALLSGLVAKEALVSSMVVLYRAPDAAALVGALPGHFSRGSAAAFLVFTLLYPPCLSALSAMRRELGSRSLMWLSAGLQIAAAYVMAAAAYGFFGLFGG